MAPSKREIAFAIAYPLITGALIYILTEPKTADVAICAIIWTLLWWFVFAVAGALESFH